MAEESYSFSNARTRLDEIVSQVRKKDTSLEKSLDLLEEGVRLANQCTELIDHVDWDIAAGKGPVDEQDAAADGADAADDGEVGERDEAQSEAVAVEASDEVHAHDARDVEDDADR